MKPLTLTTEQKAAAFDKIVELCVEEFEGAERTSKTESGRLQLGGRGGFVKDIAEHIFEEAMKQAYGENVFDEYNAFFS